MSEENVEILRGILSEMARGNFWALGPFLDTEVEWIWAPEFRGSWAKRSSVARGSRSRYPGVFRAMGAIHVGG